MFGGALATRLPHANAGAHQHRRAVPDGGLTVVQRLVGVVARVDARWRRGTGTAGRRARRCAGSRRRFIGTRRVQKFGPVPPARARSRPARSGCARRCLEERRRVERVVDRRRPRCGTTGSLHLRVVEAGQRCRGSARSRCCHAGVLERAAQLLRRLVVDADGRLPAEQALARPGELVVVGLPRRR